MKAKKKSAKKSNIGHSRHLVIGAGEVGQAIYEVLKGHYKADIRDVEDGLKGPYDVLHIAYPPVLGFVDITKRYIKKYKSELVIVHSTVPVGTTSKIGKNAVHSPIRGIHPHLAEGIKTFVKYFAGEKAEEASAYFKKIRVPVKTFKKPETTELAKILDTTYYGWNIIFAKEVARICEEEGLDFDDVYTTPNKDYNEGYMKLGKENVVRPVLKATPGKIGGHCVVPNCDLLDDWLTKVIKERNEQYQ